MFVTALIASPLVRKGLVALVVVSVIGGMYFTIKSLRNDVESYKINQAKLIDGIEDQKDLIVHQQEAIKDWQKSINELTTVYGSLVDIKDNSGKRIRSLRNEISRIENSDQDEYELSASVNTIYNDLNGMFRRSTGGDSQ